MEELVVSESLDNNLSHGNKELVKSDNEIECTQNEVFEIPSPQPHSGAAARIPFSNKMIRMDTVAFEGTMERPRSFSDASHSSALRQSVLKKLQGRLIPEHKTAMKVFVRRESKVVKSHDDNDRDIASDAEFGFHAEPRKESGGFTSVDNLLDNKPGLKDFTSSQQQSQNYRQYLNKQLKLFHQCHGKTVHDDMDDEAERLVVRKEEPKKGISRRRSSTSSVNEQNEEANAGASEFEHSRSRNAVGIKVRRGRSSVSDLPVRSSGLVYKHFDPQFRAQLLRKELEKLRKMRHVRRNSESVRQRFESILRLKSTSDLHVRFADEFEDIAKTETPAISDEPMNSKPQLRHTNSADLYAGRFDNQKQSDSSTSRPEVFSHSGPSGLDSREQLQEGYRSVDLLTRSNSRRVNTERGQTQYRSRSAAAIERNRQEQNSQDWNKLGSSQSGHLSKSVTNLRRKQDTIRKFNYSSVELQREHVRGKYQKEKVNRVESLSPDDTSINLERELLIAQERLQMLRGVQRDGKAVSDNRSDEEKYAALSRSKIVHSKSSSLDSQELQANGGRLAGNVSKERVTLSRPDTKGGQRVKQTAYVKPHLKTDHETGGARVDSDDLFNKFPEQSVTMYKNKAQTDLSDLDRKFTKGATSVTSKVPNISNKDSKHLQKPNDQRDVNRKPNFDTNSAVPKKSVGSTIPKTRHVETKKYSHDLKANHIDTLKAQGGPKTSHVETVKAKNEQVSSHIDRLDSKGESVQRKTGQNSGMLSEGGGNQKVVLRQCIVGSDVVFGLVAVQDLEKKVGYSL